MPISATRRLSLLLFLFLAGLLLVPDASAQKKNIKSLHVRSGTHGTTLPTHPFSRAAGSGVDEVEPNNSVAEAQVLSGDYPITVNGSIEVADEGDIVFRDGEGNVVDDIEDGFRITTTTPGLSISLTGLAADCDLYLADENATMILDASFQIGLTSESLDLPGLPAGTYLIGISIWDPEPIAATSDYVLTVDAASVEPMAEVEPNDSIGEAQPLNGAMRMAVTGTIDVDDVGEFGLQMDADDFEDLYTITTTAPGLHAELRLLSADCDIYVLSEAGEIIDGAANEGLISEVFDDPNLPAGTYLIAVTIFDPDPIENSTSYVLITEGAVATASEAETEAPGQIVLSQNYPNPFNPETAIPYSLSTPEQVRLEIFDLQGRRIRTLVTGIQTPGQHVARWDGRADGGTSMPSGAYIYRLSAGAQIQSKTLVLLR